jgi:hypothetical protein
MRQFPAFLGSPTKCATNRCKQKPTAKSYSPRGTIIYTCKQHSDVPQFYFGIWPLNDDTHGWDFQIEQWVKKGDK